MTPRQMRARMLAQDLDIVARLLGELALLTDGASPPKLFISEADNSKLLAARKVIRESIEKLNKFE